VSIAKCLILHVKTDTRAYPRFDETEFEGSDPHARINNYPIHFRGVLEILHLDWLTPLGRKYLQQDLRKRDLELTLHSTINPTSDLTLERIYRRDPVMRSTGKGLTVKVIIQGEKALSALFLTCDILCFFGITARL
jgi:hypothetical protein